MILIHSYDHKKKKGFLRFERTLYLSQASNGMHFLFGKILFNNLSSQLTAY